MRSIYLIRHAESVMNVQPQLIGGRSNDAMLTPQGIQQAQALGRLLKTNIDLPERVYSSPAVRTLVTARHAFDVMGINPPIVQDDRLLEMEQGEYVGRDRSTVYTSDVLGEIERLGKDFKLPGGESMNDVGGRMNEWLESTVPSIGPVFVFTHSIAIRCLVAHLEGWSRQQTYEAAMPNTSVTRFDAEYSEWHVAFVGQLPTRLSAVRNLTS